MASTSEAKCETGGVCFQLRGPTPPGSRSALATLPLRGRDKAGARHRPCSLAARGAPAFLNVSLSTRERSAERRVRFLRAASLSRRGRLSALHLRRSSRRRAALLKPALQRAARFPERPAEPVPSASSSQRVLVPAGGAPAPPGSVLCESTPAGAAPCSIIKTPHDGDYAGLDIRLPVGQYPSHKRGN